MFYVNVFAILKGFNTISSILRHYLLGYNSKSALQHIRDMYSKNPFAKDILSVYTTTGYQSIILLGTWTLRNYS